MQRKSCTGPECRVAIQIQSKEQRQNWLDQIVRERAATASAAGLDVDSFSRLSKSEQDKALEHRVLASAKKKIQK